MGDALLVSPILYENQTSAPAYFPRGTWYDFYSGKAIDASHNGTLGRVEVRFALSHSTLHVSEPPACRVEHAAVCSGLRSCLHALKDRKSLLHCMSTRTLQAAGMHCANMCRVRASGVQAVLRWMHAGALSGCCLLCGACTGGRDGQRPPTRAGRQHCPHGAGQAIHADRRRAQRQPGARRGLPGRELHHRWFGSRPLLRSPLSNPSNPPLSPEHQACTIPWPGHAPCLLHSACRSPVLFSCAWPAAMLSNLRCAAYALAALLASGHAAC
jgi:hypothetical protein